MQTTWIIVAKADQAKVYQLEKHPFYLRLTNELSHPASRLKKNDLIATEGGHHDTTGMPRGNTSFHGNPLSDEHTKFAKQLVNLLEQARNHQRFTNLILIAEPGFLGYLNIELNKSLEQLVTKRIHKNYTQLTEEQLLEVVLAKPD